MTERYNMDLDIKTLVIYSHFLICSLSQRLYFKYTENVVITSPGSSFKNGRELVQSPETSEYHQAQQTTVLQLQGDFSDRHLHREIQQGAQCSS